MARLARIVAPYYPHHVIQRGNRRQRVFFSDDDYHRYLAYLKHYTRLFDLSLWAYCLMDNHVHMIVVPKNVESLAKAIGELHRQYTRDIHFREGWRGYLWQGRFQSYPMDEKYLYSAMRYVENNPVKAGIVSLAEEYPWSSAYSHIFKTESELITGDCGFYNDVQDWKEYLSLGINKETAEEKRIDYHSRTGRPMGDKPYLQKLEKITGRKLMRRRPGPKSGS